MGLLAYGSIYESTINYKGSDRLDITVKSSKEAKFLAPTWDMVKGYKQGRLSEKEYKEKYLSLMKASYRKDRMKWEALLRME